MSTEIKSPTFPESVIDGTIANWIKQEGDTVSQDEVIAEIETDKVVLEVVAPFDGELKKIVKNAGDTVTSAEVIAEFERGDASSEEADTSEVETKSVQSEVNQDQSESLSSPQELPQENMPEETIGSEPESTTETLKAKAGPAAKRLMSEESIDPKDVKPTGKGGRITKADVIAHMSPDDELTTAPAVSELQSFGEEERVPMSRLRTTIAKRLVKVQQDTAMLTTFNEVDMQPIKDLRAKYGEEFFAEHGTKLGFMGFFVSAAVQALKKFPIVNASIDNEDIIYHGFQDIGVAVSTDRGLVVPVVRDAGNLSIADIELKITEYSEKAREGKLSIDEMQGGTFTISNGGIFGSLLSTPILNAPQTAILGMHKIQDRPIALNGEVVIRPMMYLAMSYDHRLLDGKEAVTFLVAIKEMLESPERLLLNL
jgi:2-oxoglutarate dehydrogenase E2 component (dihydrolipoamide succinyltransferase)